MKTYKTIIDVRSEGEFMDGNVPGSINISLQDIQDKLEDIKKMDQPIALCCQSGARSGVATQFLTQQGVNCFNAGGWKSVEFAIENGVLCLEN